MRTTWLGCPGHLGRTQTSMQPMGGSSTNFRMQHRRSLLGPKCLWIRLNVPHGLNRGTTSHWAYIRAQATIACTLIDGSLSRTAPTSIIACASWQDSQKSHNDISLSIQHPNKDDFFYFACRVSIQRTKSFKFQMYMFCKLRIFFLGALFMIHT